MRDYRAMPPGPSAFDDLLGRSATLTFRRFGPAGAFLSKGGPGAGPEDPTLLLLGAEIPEGAREGDEITVFVYQDSEGRPLATTRTPKLRRGEVAFLEVTACTNFGAFVDWGLPKELLVPFSEQTRDVRVGERHPIGLYLDDRGRLTGTMRVNELLREAPPGIVPDAWLSGEALRNDPAIGLFVIAERTWVGLVPKSEPHTLSRGQGARFRVANVLPDGKVELSLRGHAHEELERDAQKILEALSKAPTKRFGDRSSPEEIRATFGLTKKAFKRAVGRLLKRRLVSIDDDGFVVVRADVSAKTSGNSAPEPPKRDPVQSRSPPWSPHAPSPRSHSGSSPGAPGSQKAPRSHAAATPSGRSTSGSTFRKAAKPKRTGR